MMKTAWCITLLIGLAFFTACASGPETPPLPRHIAQAERQLRLGNQLYTKGCYGKAIAHYKQAHERFAAADHLEGVANSLNSAANVLYQQGDFDGAVNIFNEAAQTYAIAGNDRGVVRATVNKSAALIALGRLKQATEALDRADDKAWVEQLLIPLRLKTRALLLIERKKYEDAHPLLISALAAVPSDTSIQAANILYTLGHLELLNGQAPPAMDHLNRALAIDRDAGAYPNIAKDLEALGNCNAVMNRYTESVAAYKRSIKIFALLIMPDQVERVMVRLESVAEKANVDTRAIRFWARQWLDGKGEANLCR